MHQNRHFPKGPLATSLEFLFTVWRFWRLIAIFAKIATFKRAPFPSRLNFSLQFGNFWRLIAIPAIFANACISGHISCDVQGKVVPLKRITIPRLELSAATVSVRLEKMIKRELKLAVNRSFFWTDSTSVLKYVANSHTRFHTFVSNRFSQIHDCSSPSQWRCVPSKLNPADDASRGLNVYELLTNSRWKVGPPLL